MTHRTLDLLDTAQLLVPTLAEREGATVAARHVPAETIADYHRTGILRVMQPRRFGGHEASFGLFSRIIEILAEGCAASAWVYAVLGEHQWIIACMPEQAQIDVWGDDPLAVASSSLAPRETARATPGGWRLAHLIHCLYCRATWAYILLISNHMDCAAPLLAGPRFRPYLSGAGG